MTIDVCVEQIMILGGEALYIIILFLELSSVLLPYGKSAKVSSHFTTETSQLKMLIWAITWKN